MTETVTVTPRFGLDSDGNPVADGTPGDLEAFAVEPGNSTITYTNAGDVDNVAFTVFFQAAVAIKDDDLILVRGKPCNARVQLWENPYATHGGFVVLAESVTGAS
jgi:hypothetical protein